jgi:transposase
MSSLRDSQAMLIPRPWVLIIGTWYKQRNRYLRMLLVVGATAVLRYVCQKPSWITGLLARKTVRLASVALANNTEPRRVSRRLLILRDWSHDEANSTLFT